MFYQTINYKTNTNYLFILHKKYLKLFEIKIKII